MMTIKKTTDLEADELAYIKANLPYLDIKDFATVRVDRKDKTGRISRIAGEEFTEAKKAELCGLNLMDVMKVAYAKKTGKRLDKATRNKFTRKEISNIAKVIN